MMTGNYMVSAQANNGFGEVRHSIEVDTFGQGESRTYGGCDEAESVSGHLDSVEQVVKPALGRGRFCLFLSKPRRLCRAASSTYRFDRASLEIEQRE